jgi:small-conductance mechanosensitive channel
MKEISIDFLGVSDIWVILILFVFFLFILLLLVFAVNLVLIRLGKLIEKNTGQKIGADVVKSIRRPLIAILFFQCLYWLLHYFIESAPSNAIWPSLLGQTNTIVVICTIFLGSISLVSLSRVLFNTYLDRMTEKDLGSAKILPTLRRLTTIVVYVLAVMLSFDYMGIAISPILAGFGIGGLALALAVQPTLSNFFAGTYLVSGNVITPGDFVELENGFRGYVTEIGWRSTRLRTPFNNSVVIPNSRLSDSMITNYNNPDAPIGVLIECGVSYDSDLNFVERIALEVAQSVVQDLPEAINDTPWFSFSHFGESNIDFWVWVTAKDYVSSFKLKSEIIKAIHSKFNEEGVTINYPVRTVYMENEG